MKKNKKEWLFLLFLLVNFAVFSQGTDNYRLDILVNGILKKQLNYPQAKIPIINAVMGDEIRFKVTTVAGEASKPGIHGLTHTWVAPFSGDVLFHCDPDMQPGLPKPFIGLDSRVHTLMLRNYPEGYKPNYADWVRTVSGTEVSYTLNWTADRLMEANKIKYVPSFRWSKFHLNNDGTKKVMGTKNGSPIYQRQNQKEGLNMQYLHYFNDWLNSNYRQYDGSAKYMMGFDDDEIGYFNHQQYKADEPRLDGQNPQKYVVKLERLPWKEVLEGDEEVDQVTGFPKKGFPLNMMVNAHRRFQLSAANSNLDLEKINYKGYEIQDANTSVSQPNGMGINIKNPGQITVKLGVNKEIKLKFNVVSPLDKEISSQEIEARELGFYEALSGPKAPSYGEENVVYWLRGVENKSITEQDKYTLEYNVMNRLGKITKTEIKVADIIAEKEQYPGNLSWSQWLNTSTTKTYGFNIGRPSYAWIVAYYQRTPNAEKVPVAGKAIVPIFLMFCGLEKMNDEKFPQGKGHGSKIFLEDIRDHRTDRFSQQRNFGLPGETDKLRYVEKYTNKYVIEKGTKLTFNTFDGDPHQLDNNEEEWYLSNKAIALRVKDNVLDGTASTGEAAYLEYFISDIGGQNIRKLPGKVTGKNVSHTFNNVGTYEIVVKYRNTSDVYNQVKVVDYPEVDVNGEKKQTQGRIERRILSSKELKWLGISDQADSYEAFEVVDVFTPFLWKDGYRNQNVKAGKPNRWALNNDYLDAYNWYTNFADNSKLKTEERLLRNLESFFEKKRTKWFWKDWALHYSSNWLRPLDAQNRQGLPDYVSENLLTRVYKDSDLYPYTEYFKNNLFDTTKYANQLRTPWQFVIPLISYTDYHGYRFRTNPSCIYDLEKVFSSVNGAFTGAPPNPSDPTLIQAPDISDDDKNLQEFYYNVINGRIIIKKKELLFDNLIAYQQDIPNKVLRNNLIAVYNKNKENIDLKTLQNSTLSDGNYYLIDQNNLCAFVEKTGLLNWKATTDNSGVKKYSSCSQLELEKDKSATNSYTIKVKGTDLQLALDPKKYHYYKVTSSASGSKMISSNEIKSEKTPSSNKIELYTHPDVQAPFSNVLAQNDMVSLPYAFVDVPEVPSPPQPFAHAAQQDHVLKNALGGVFGTTAAIGTLYGVYRWVKSPRGYGKISRFKNMFPLNNICKDSNEPLLGGPKTD